MRRFAFPIVGLVILVATSAGCTVLAITGGAAAGAAGYAYATGDVERTYPYSVDTVWQATQAALADLEIPAAYQGKDQLKGRIDAHTATGDHIKIKLESSGPYTKLNVRVNTFGNKSISWAILRKVDSYLSQTAPGLTQGLGSGSSPATEQPMSDAPYGNTLSSGSAPR